MRQAAYIPNDQFDLVVLSPVINMEEIKRAYLDPFGIDQASTVVFSLHLAPGKKKTPVKEIQEFITTTMVPELKKAGPTYIVCTDAEYFKVLTKSAKADAQLGYVLDCAFGPWKVVYVPSFRAIFYDPVKIKAKIAQSMEALCDHAWGSYTAPGTDLLKYEFYPQGVEEIEDALNQLLEMGVDLTSDIEAFSLKHYDSGIGTIAFAWNKEEGIAFAVDYEPIPGATEAPFGRKVHNAPVRALLKKFFTALTKKLTWHNISYDVYVLVYQLWMNDLLDTEGMLEGFEVMLDPARWDDTKLITYLATNSCAGNKLSLKEQAQEYAGNYAESEIGDITKIPLERLLRYNLIDTCSTWFVREKHWDTMVADDQLDIYENLFKPAITDIVQMQLTGMPLYMPQVQKVSKLLGVIEKHALNKIQQSRIIHDFTHQLNLAWVEEFNITRKKKRVSIADAKEVFNPNSPKQLQTLLYGQGTGCLGLPIIELTDSKLPATDADTLRSLRTHANDAEVVALLDTFLEYKAVDKLISSFLPAMLAAPQGPDGWWYLFGNFVLGGTVSGRLSSNSPNLQNLPANVVMVISEALMQLLGDEILPYMVKDGLSLGKLIKSCFIAPPGWLFVGLDFALI